MIVAVVLVLVALAALMVALGCLAAVSLAALWRCRGGR